MPVDPRDSKPVEYLRRHGPSARADLPVSSLGENVRRLIHFVKIRGGPDGGGASESHGGRTTDIAYLPAEHSMDEAIRAWLKHNRDTAAKLSPRSLRRKLRSSVNQEHRQTVSRVLDEEGYEVDHSKGDKAKYERTECPFCGETVGQLPAHLPCSDES